MGLRLVRTAGQGEHQQARQSKVVGWKDCGDDAWQSWEKQAHQVKRASAQCQVLTGGGDAAGVHGGLESGVEAAGAGGEVGLGLGSPTAADVLQVKGDEQSGFRSAKQL